MSTLLILNGPNLNLLGTREPEKYGLETLEQINQQLTTAASAAGLTATCFQSNAEHDLIQRIHDANQEGVDYIVFNPGAFTHTSVAIRDALLGVAIPLLKFTFQTSMREKNFVVTPIFLILPMVLFVASAQIATTLPYRQWLLN